MEGIGDTGIMTDFRQSSADFFKTKTETDMINQSLKKDGRIPKKEMGKDEFLQLLITQLRHQDPTKPMEDREFIAQMAQFSSLEQMLNFNTNMGKLLENHSFQSSFNLIGMNVDIETGNVDSETGNALIESGKYSRTEAYDLVRKLVQKSIDKKTEKSILS